MLDDISMTGSEDDDESDVSHSQSLESKRGEQSRRGEAEVDDGKGDHRSSRSRSSSLSSTSSTELSDLPLENNESVIKPTSTLPSKPQDPSAPKAIIDRISLLWGGSDWLTEEVVSEKQNGCTLACLSQIEKLATVTSNESLKPGHYPIRVKEFISICFAARVESERNSALRTISSREYSKAFTMLLKEKGIKVPRNKPTEIQNRLKIGSCGFCRDRKTKCIVLIDSPIVASKELGMEGRSCLACQKKGIVCSARNGAIVKEPKIKPFDSSSSKPSLTPKSQLGSTLKKSPTAQTQVVNKEPRSNDSPLTSVLLSDSNISFSDISSIQPSLPPARRGRPKKIRVEEDQFEDERDVSEAVERECHFIKMKINELKCLLNEQDGEDSSRISDFEDSSSRKRKTREDSEFNELELGNIFEDAELQQVIGHFAREQMAEIRNEERESGN